MCVCTVCVSDEVIPHAPLSRPSGDADETNKPVRSCGVAVAWHRAGMMVFAVPMGGARLLARVSSTHRSRRSPLGKHGKHNPCRETRGEGGGRAGGGRLLRCKKALFNLSSPKTFARNLQGQLKFYIYHNVLLLLIFPPLTAPPAPPAPSFNPRGCDNCQTKPRSSGIIGGRFSWHLCHFFQLNSNILKSE